MKKLLIGAVSAVALSFAFAGSASAAPGASQFCTANEDFPWLGFSSHGECVSTFQNLFNNGNADAVGACKFIRSVLPGPFEAFYGNLGRCVSSIRTS